MSANTAWVAYYRVSTSKQGVSGLGLEAQKEAVQRFLRPGDTLAAEYIEVESGTNSERPRLAEAMGECRRTGARLLIANLSRLARSVRFISALMESDVRFTAVDMPTADAFRLHIEAAISEDEARKVSLRTRAALAAARKRGVVLGGFRGRHLTPAERSKGSAMANAARAAQARQSALDLMPTIDRARAAGATTASAISRWLASNGVPTPTGHGAWQAIMVSRILSRV